MSSPAYGVGTTWFMNYPHNLEGELDEAVITGLEAALAAGFRHIDLAEMYGNEREAGVAIGRWLEARQSEGQTREAARQALWITGKLWNNMGGDIEAACRATVGRLRCDYLDLYLMHGPVSLLRQRSPDRCPEGLSNIAVWRRMETLVDLGLTSNVGLSNFRGTDIEELFAHELRHVPTVHQVEFHPHLQQPRLQRISEGRGMRMAAYGSLAPLTSDACKSGPVAALVAELALHRGIPQALVLQAYAVQRGYTVITTSRTPSRLQEYLMLSSVTLDPGEIAALDEAGRALPHRVFWDQQLIGSDAGLI